MKTLAITVSTVLFLGLSALTVSGLQSVSACSDSNKVGLSLISGSVTKRADNTFDYVVLAKWDTKGKPFLGGVDVDHALGLAGLGTYGVDHVIMSPSTFFPSSCSGEISIHVTGHKSIQGIGWVSTKVSMGPAPNNASDTYVQEIR